MVWPSNETPVARERTQNKSSERPHVERWLMQCSDVALAIGREIAFDIVCCVLSTTKNCKYSQSRANSKRGTWVRNQQHRFPCRVAVGNAESRR